MGKTLRNRVHARRRAGLRVGINLTRELERQIIQLIQRGGAERLYRRSNTRTLYRVEIDGIPFRVSYDRSRKCIVTVFEDNKKEEEVR